MKQQEKDNTAHRGSMMPHATPPGENQKFIKNDQYFRLCIYIFVLVVACAVAVKAIISIDETKAFFSNLFRAVGPFLIAILIAYILNPFVRGSYRFIRKRWEKLPEKVSLVFAMLFVYMVGLGMIIGLLIYVLPEIVRNLIELVDYIPTAYQALIDFLVLYPLLLVMKRKTACALQLKYYGDKKLEKDGNLYTLVSGNF